MRILSLFIVVLGLVSCVGDDIEQDFVEPQVRISNIPESIAAGETFQMNVSFLNNVGIPTSAEFIFMSSNEDVATVTSSGLISANSQGMATISVETEFEGSAYSEEFSFEVSEETVVEELTGSGVITTTSSYLLEGDFVIENTDEGLIINVADNYKASTALPGLYIYLTNNPGTTSGALELGKVEVFNGAHTYEVAGVKLDEFSHLLYFCKPFNVKVGDGEINK